MTKDALLALKLTAALSISVAFNVGILAQPDGAVQSDIPSNIEVASPFRPLLKSMLLRSSMFRRQCLRIANEPELNVRLHPFLGPRPAGTRAVTRLAKGPNGHLLADVNVNAGDQAVEMIAHEFEHIIEQLDGVDLPSKAALPDSGVHLIDNGQLMFETARAMKIGAKVASEIRAALQRAD